jgi:Putative restriction endonuclease
MATVIAKVKTPSRRPQASKPKTVVDGEYLLTADEFDRIDSVLDRRAELIDGRIMERPDVDPPHALVGNLLNTILSGLLHDQSLSNRYYVSVGMPLRISQYTEPLPDVMIIRGTLRSYASKHPGPTDMALVIEVSFSTLSKDRGKNSDCTPKPASRLIGSSILRTGGSRHTPIRSLTLIGPKVLTRTNGFSNRETKSKSSWEPSQLARLRSPRSCHKRSAGGVRLV